MHRSTTALALTGALALTLLAPSSAVAAEELPEVTFGIEPADEDGKPDDRVSFRWALDPGDVVKDRVLVTNASDQDMTFGLAASDGVVTDQGVFDLLPPDVEPVDVGTWVSIPESVEVPANKSVAVEFTLRVPDDAAPGDHPGGIVALATAESQTDGGPQVGVTNRVGARIHLRVSGELVPAVALTDVTTRYEAAANPFRPGRLHVSYTVVNDGNVRVSSIQQFQVSGLLGQDVTARGPSGTVVGQQREVLPGQDAHVSTTLDGVWPWVELTTALTAHQDPVGEDVLPGQLPTAQAEATTLAVPWAQLALLAAIGLVVAGVVLLRRRRRRTFARRLEQARLDGARTALAQG